MNKAERRIQMALAFAEMTVEVICAISKFADKYRSLSEEAKNVGLLTGKAEGPNKSDE